MFSRFFILIPGEKSGKNRENIILKSHDKLLIIKHVKTSNKVFFITISTEKWLFMFLLLAEMDE